MNTLRIAHALAFTVLVAAVAGCVETPSSSAREPRSSVLVEPHLDSSHGTTSYAPKYAGASPRIDRLRQ